MRFRPLISALLCIIAFSTAAGAEKVKKKIDPRDLVMVKDDPVWKLDKIYEGGKFEPYCQIMNDGIWTFAYDTAEEMSHHRTFAFFLIFDDDCRLKGVWNIPSRNAHMPWKIKAPFFFGEGKDITIFDARFDVSNPVIHWTFGQGSYLMGTDTYCQMIKGRKRADDMVERGQDLVEMVCSRAFQRNGDKNWADN